MNWIDLTIFGIYFIIILGIGFYFYRKNKSKEDYYVGGRKISSYHIGLSIVATDVGGGFSIGLGGLGFLMGLSGSWLLFTGLVGAWMAAVTIVPRLKRLDREHKFLTYPEFLKHRYNKKVALAASIISGIGYLGFTSAQILAGAKLAAGSVFAHFTWIDPLTFALYIMAGVIMIYTVLGGLKAVIYTDTVQWIVLFTGLLFIGIPACYIEVGGWTAMRAALPGEFFTLTNVKWTQIVNWFVTIIPIWFIAMTLYQRIYASPTVKDAKKAFFIAGLLEYPLMAFIGVVLGQMARVVFPAAEAEMAMPMLLRDALPIGVTGVVLAAYFSAIMSTADSCLIASSANWVQDIIQPMTGGRLTARKNMILSQVVTLIVGLLALLLATRFTMVLDIILYAYAFMVSGLLVPTIAGYYYKKSHPTAAFASMIAGGSLTLTLIATNVYLPYDLDPTLFGILTSLGVFVLSTVILNSSVNKSDYPFKSD
ncbi:sodium:solute symporter family protein [candidate division KSB1 bacterium]|nr:sodium:solute symporter family protein [candidate division KSB1 bacterium]